MVAFSYLARPAKHVLRQMLVEALRRLDRLADLGDYRYVGFGGLEFVDFDLFHRQLAITQMISIEIDTNGYARYVANRPFGEIHVLPGAASQHLPLLDWSDLSIVWLDYEQRLDDEVLNDVSHLSRELSPGSVLIVTVNARTPSRGERLATLETNVGAHRIPLGTGEKSLARWGFAEAQREILFGAMRQEFRTRPDRSRFEQLFDIQYVDSVSMQTYGGIVSSPALEKTIESLELAKLDFVRSRGQPAVRIELPVLTQREVIELNQQLPRRADHTLEAEGLTESELDNYEHFYRWYRLAG